MSESKSSEINPIMSAHENYVRKKSEARILTQEKIDEQIKNYIALLTRRLEDLIWLIQRMSTAHRPNFFARAGVSADNDI